MILLFLIFKSEQTFSIHLRDCLSDCVEFFTSQTISPRLPEFPDHCVEYIYFLAVVFTFGSRSIGSRKVLHFQREMAKITFFNKWILKDAGGAHNVPTHAPKKQHLATLL